MIFLLSLLHIWYRTTNSPSFSKYPTSRTSSLYVFPLMWPQELFFQPHLAQGYCEGVVSRLSCLDMKFLCRFKKPVVTKRASFRASSASGVNANSDGEFPGAIQHSGYCPTPYQSFPQRCESQERRRLFILIPFSHIREMRVRTLSIFSSTKS